jgi:hypothetical protein
MNAGDDGWRMMILRDGSLTAPGLSAAAESAA